MIFVNTRLVDTIFSIVLVLFSISFTWMVTERIKRFPKIRRFYSIIGLLMLFGKKFEEEERIKSDLFVLLSSWLTILCFLALSIFALLFYYRFFTFHPIEIFVIPFLFFLAPQFMSRFISSVVFGWGKSEIRHLWENDERVFDVFTQEWKERSGLIEKEVHKEDGEIYKYGKKRAFWSLVWLVAIYGLVFVLAFYLK